MIKNNNNNTIIKNTINDTWKSYISSQLSRNVPKYKLEEILKKHNYSKNIINNELYNIKLNNITFHYKSPNIYTIDNFLTHNECNHMIKLSNGNLNRSLVSSDTKGIISDGRTGFNCWINHNHDNIVLNIASKISHLVDISLDNAESFQLIYYDKQQQYKRHYDGWLHDNSEKSNRQLKYGGQRMITALCYLNNVNEGGSTRFTKLNIDINPQKGRLLIFQNVEDKTNIRHELSEHSGMPIIEGEKYAFNLWFREKKYKK